VPLLAVRIDDMGDTLRSSGRLPGLGFLLLLILLAAPALAEGVRIERTSPEVRQAPPGEVVTHVFAVYGQGRARPSFVSEHSWPVLSPEHEIVLDPQKATFVAVSIRIPPGTVEGSRDRLQVQIGDARAYAYSQAAYQPGMEVGWPRKIEYLPPVGYLPVSLKNTGNGPDTFLLRLESMDMEPVFSTRIPLDPGETATLRIPITAYDSYKLIVTSLRSRIRQEGLVIANLAPSSAGGSFRLVGRLGVAYGYPGYFSISAGLVGPLSDFAYLNFGIGYALGGIPAGSASISFENGYFSIIYGSSYGAALGFHQGGLSVAMSLSGPEPRYSLNLDFSASSASYGLAASLSRDSSFRLNARLGLHAQVDNLIPEFESDTLRGELAFLPAESRVYGELSYAFHYRKWPLRLIYGADWASGSPLINRLSADANPQQAGFGGQISWTGQGVRDWGVAFASNSKRLQIESPLPFYLGLNAGANRFRAFVGATLDLPDPWSDLSGQIEAKYSNEDWSFTISGSSRASSFEGLTLWDVGGRLGWPLSENQISLGVRAGSSYLRGHASLDWAPWKPGLNTRLGLEMPAGGAMLRASLGHEWYGGRTSFGLSADLPWLVEVPPEVVEFFGGRRAGTVKGVVEVQGPSRFRRGIVVRAGGETTTTDAEGRFELQLPPGEYEVEIDRSRLPAVLVAVKASEKVKVRLKETVSVRLQVAVRSLLEGRVVVEGESLQAPPRFAVALQDERGRETSLYTSSDGSFKLEGLPPGMYTVRLLTDLLPPGWKAVKPEATVLLEPGEVGRVELVVSAPERKVYRGGLQILSVKPETETAPPGAAPLVTVRLKGEATQVLIESRNKVVGILLPGAEEGVWTGRARLPDDYEGPLPLQVVARAGDQEARFPFFISVSQKAPWGVVRTLPVARPGQELPVAVHWYLPVEQSWLEIGGEKVELTGNGADWRGKFVIPEGLSGRLQIVAKATAGSEKPIQVRRYVLIR